MTEESSKVINRRRLRNQRNAAAALKKKATSQDEDDNITAVAITTATSTGIEALLPEYDHSTGSMDETAEPLSAKKIKTKKKGDGRDTSEKSTDKSSGKKSKKKKKADGIGGSFRSVVSRDSSSKIDDSFRSTVSRDSSSKRRRKKGIDSSKNDPATPRKESKKKSKHKSSGDPSVCRSRSDMDESFHRDSSHRDIKMATPIDVSKFKFTSLATFSSDDGEEVPFWKKSGAASRRNSPSFNEDMDNVPSLEEDDTILSTDEDYLSKKAGKYIYPEAKKKVSAPPLSDDSDDSDLESSSDDEDDKAEWESKREIFGSFRSQDSNQVAYVPKKEISSGDEEPESDEDEDNQLQKEVLPPWANAKKNLKKNRNTSVTKSQASLVKEDNDTPKGEEKGGDADPHKAAVPSWAKAKRATMDKSGSTTNIAPPSENVDRRNDENSSTNAKDSGKKEDKDAPKANLPSWATDWRTSRSKNEGTTNTGVPAQSNNEEKHITAKESETQEDTSKSNVPPWAKARRNSLKTTESKNDTAAAAQNVIDDKNNASAAKESSDKNEDEKDASQSGLPSWAKKFRKTSMKKTESTRKTTATAQNVSDDKNNGDAAKESSDSKEDGEHEKKANLPPWAKARQKSLKKTGSIRNTAAPAQSIIDDTNNDTSERESDSKEDGEDITKASMPPWAKARQKSLKKTDSIRNTAAAAAAQTIINDKKNETSEKESDNKEDGEDATKASLPPWAKARQKSLTKTDSIRNTAIPAQTIINDKNSDKAEKESEIKEEEKDESQPGLPSWAKARQQSLKMTGSVRNTVASEQNFISDKSSDKAEKESEINEEEKDESPSGVPSWAKARHTSLKKIGSVRNNVPSSKTVSETQHKDSDNGSDQKPNESESGQTNSDAGVPAWAKLKIRSQKAAEDTGKSAIQPNKNDKSKISEGKIENESSEKDNGQDATQANLPAWAKARKSLKKGRSIRNTAAPAPASDPALAPDPVVNKDDSNDDSVTSEKESDNKPEWMKTQWMKKNTRSTSTGSETKKTVVHTDSSPPPTETPEPDADQLDRRPSWAKARNTLKPSGSRSIQPASSKEKEQEQLAQSNQSDADKLPPKAKSYQSSTIRPSSVGKPLWQKKKSSITPISFLPLKGDLTSNDDADSSTSGAISASVPPRKNKLRRSFSERSVSTSTSVTSMGSKDSQGTSQSHRNRMAVYLGKSTHGSSPSVSIHNIEYKNDSNKPPVAPWVKGRVKPSVNSDQALETPSKKSSIASATPKASNKHSGGGLLRSTSGGLNVKDRTKAWGGSSHHTGSRNDDTSSIGTGGGISSADVEDDENSVPSVKERLKAWKETTASDSSRGIPTKVSITKSDDEDDLDTSIMKTASSFTNDENPNTRPDITASIETDAYGRTKAKTWATKPSSVPAYAAGRMALKKVKKTTPPSEDTDCKHLSESSQSAELSTEKKGSENLEKIEPQEQRRPSYKREIPNVAKGGEGSSLSDDKTKDDDTNVEIVKKVNETENESIKPSHLSTIIRKVAKPDPSKWKRNTGTTSASNHGAPRLRRVGKPNEQKWKESKVQDDNAGKMYSSHHGLLRPVAQRKEDGKSTGDDSSTSVAEFASDDSSVSTAENKTDEDFEPDDETNQRKVKINASEDDTSGGNDGKGACRRSMLKTDDEKVLSKIASLRNLQSRLFGKGGARDEENKAVTKDDIGEGDSNEKESESQRSTPTASNLDSDVTEGELFTDKKVFISKNASDEASVCKAEESSSSTPVVVTEDNECSKLDDCVEKDSSIENGVEDTTTKGKEAIVGSDGAEAEAQVEDESCVNDGIDDSADTEEIDKENYLSRERHTDDVENLAIEDKSVPEVDGVEGEIIMEVGPVVKDDSSVEIEEFSQENKPDLNNDDVTEAEENTLENKPPINDDDCTKSEVVTQRNKGVAENINDNEEHGVSESEKDNSEDESVTKGNDDGVAEVEGEESSEENECLVNNVDGSDKHEEITQENDIVSRDDQISKDGEVAPLNQPMTNIDEAEVIAQEEDSDVSNRAEEISREEEPTEQNGVSAAKNNAPEEKILPSEAEVLCEAVDSNEGESVEGVEISQEDNPTTRHNDDDDVENNTENETSKDNISGEAELFTEEENPVLINEDAAKCEEISHVNESFLTSTVEVDADELEHVDVSEREGAEVDDESVPASTFENNAGNDVESSEIEPSTIDDKSPSDSPRDIEECKVDTGESESSEHEEKCNIDDNPGTGPPGVKNAGGVESSSLEGEPTSVSSVEDVNIKNDDSENDKSVAKDAILEVEYSQPSLAKDNRSENETDAEPSAQNEKSTDAPTIEESNENNKLEVDVGEIKKSAAEELMQVHRTEDGGGKEESEETELGKLDDDDAELDLSDEDAIDKKSERCEIDDNTEIDESKTDAVAKTLDQNLQKLTQLPDSTEACSDDVEADKQNIEDHLTNAQDIGETEMQQLEDRSTSLSEDIDQPCVLMEEKIDNGQSSSEKDNDVETSTTSKGCNQEKDSTIPSRDAAPDIDTEDGSAGRKDDTKIDERKPVTCANEKNADIETSEQEGEASTNIDIDQNGSNVLIQKEDSIKEIIDKNTIEPNDEEMNAVDDNITEKRDPITFTEANSDDEDSDSQEEGSVSEDTDDNSTSQSASSTEGHDARELNTSNSSIGIDSSNNGKEATSPGNDEKESKEFTPEELLEMLERSGYLGESESKTPKSESKKSVSLSSFFIDTEKVPKTDSETKKDAAYANENDNGGGKDDGLNKASAHSVNSAKKPVSMRSLSDHFGDKRKVTNGYLSQSSPVDEESSGGWSDDDSATIKSEVTDITYGTLGSAIIVDATAMTSANNEAAKKLRRMVATKAASSQEDIIPGLPPSAHASGAEGKKSQDGEILFTPPRPSVESDGSDTDVGENMDKSGKAGKKKKKKKSKKSKDASSTERDIGVGDIADDRISSKKKKGKKKKKERKKVATVEEDIVFDFDENEEDAAADRPKKKSENIGTEEDVAAERTKKKKKKKKRKGDVGSGDEVDSNDADSDGKAESDDNPEKEKKKKKKKPPLTIAE